MPKGNPAGYLPKPAPKRNRRKKPARKGSNPFKGLVKKQK